VIGHVFFVDLERRKVFFAGVTDHPIGRWVTQQARNLAMTLEDEGRILKFLIRDRDSKFVGPFDEVMTRSALGSSRHLCERPEGTRSLSVSLAPRAENASTGYRSEAKVISSACLTSLSSITTPPRPHRGIDLEIPMPYVSSKALDETTRIKRVDRLGGVIREYSLVP